MLPLLTGSVRSPRIAVSIEEKEIVVLLDTGAEVSVLPKSTMSGLIGDGSRHVKLGGESKCVKPFANADVTIEGPCHPVVPLSCCLWCEDHSPILLDGCRRTCRCGN